MDENNIGEAKVDNAVNFPCSSCGNQMLFDPDTGDMCCPYCKVHRPIDSKVIEAPEYIFFPDKDEYIAPDWKSEGNRSLVCPSCGAETVVSAATVTASCPFCGNNYVTELKSQQKIISPETLLPFRISENKANEQFSSWAKKRFWAPKKFRNGTCRVKTSGVYVPFWTFDSTLDTSYTGQGGRDRVEHYTVTVNGKPQTRTRTVTDWYPISGSERLQFDDLPACATHNIDAAMLKKLGPYSMKMLNVYSPAYLSGFFAERYNIGLKEGFEGIRQRMESDMEAHIKAKRGFDHYRAMRYQHVYSDVKFKHILLPVWISSYKYGDEVYKLMVNGETGRIAGNYPKSALKILLAVLAGVAVAALIIALIVIFGENTGGMDIYI